MSVGGSVISYPPDVEWLKRFAVLRKYIAVVGAGGGPVARTYIDAISHLGGDDVLQDIAGIKVTCLNSMLLKVVLKGKWVSNVEETEEDEVNVMCGVYPGLTSDYGLAVAADKLGLPFVNITSVGGIYTHVGGELIESMSYDELLKIAVRYDRREPGTHFPLDIPTILVLRRAGVKTYVVGKNVENLRNVFRGKAFKGTVIYP